MNLKIEGNQVTSFFKLTQHYFFTVCLTWSRFLNSLKIVDVKVSWEIYGLTEAWRNLLPIKCVECHI